MVGKRSRRRRVLWLASGLAGAVALGALLLALGRDRTDLPPFEVDPAATGDLLPEAAAHTDARCPDAPPAAKGASRTVGLTLFRGPGVPDRVLEQQLATLVAVYAPSGIRFVTDGPPRPIAMREATRPRLEGASPEGAREAVWSELLGPALEHIETYGIPTRPAIHVVFVERIAPVRSAARRLLPHLTGLTLSPEEQGGPPVRALLDVEHFTPTLFLSAQDIEALGPGDAHTTLAHEVGHALGLAHTDDDPHDLMSPAPHPCVPTLSTDQRDSIILGMVG